MIVFECIHVFGVFTTFWIHFQGVCVRLGDLETKRRENTKDMDRSENNHNNLPIHETFNQFFT